MFRLIWIVSVHIRYFLLRYMPTNIALDAIRTRKCLKWGLPAMLLAVAYLYAAALIRVFIDNGAPGWLNLLVLLFVWDAMKFAILGPVSLILLIRARIREAAARRRARKQLTGHADADYLIEQVA